MMSRMLIAFTAVALAVALATLSGCGGGDGNPVVADGPQPAMDHTNIVLRDRLGQPLTVGSTEPYSPRQTCGACHDVDHAANGYHFQQGRTDASGAIQTATNFFADGRDWLLSDGMYGKW